MVRQVVSIAPKTSLALLIMQLPELARRVGQLLRQRRDMQTAMRPAER